MSDERDDNKTILEKMPWWVELVGRWVLAVAVLCYGVYPVGRGACYTLSKFPALGEGNVLLLIAYGFQIVGWLVFFSLLLLFTYRLIRNDDV